MSLHCGHIFASKDKKFVPISEKFESTNFELSDGFCQGLIANTRRTKEFVRVSESWSYRAFELTSLTVFPRKMPHLMKTFIIDLVTDLPGNPVNF